MGFRTETRFTPPHDLRVRGYLVAASKNCCAFVLFSFSKPIPSSVPSQFSLQQQLFTFVANRYFGLFVRIS